ncbi:MAG: iron-sulfur cluster repair di-iron protein [Saprospiraceae bacterium]|nr:iron-sulfur cluster repair di-iron protein [Saprospiraceae bacterium]
MEITKLKTVGEIVAQNHKAADIFKKFGIDFCCGGGRLLSDICQDKNLNYDDVERALMKIAGGTSGLEDFDQWELDTLVDYIVDKHHFYVNENIPLIIAYSDKVAKVHGANYPETVEINKLFHLAADELLDHMYKEEEILFPFIKSLLSIRRGFSLQMPSPFATVLAPIRMMMIEHDQVEDLIRSISECSNSYKPPVAACATYRVLYAKLRDFQLDLHKHIHLENNILFPKAIELEKIIDARSN